MGINVVGRFEKSHSFELYEVTGELGGGWRGMWYRASATERERETAVVEEVGDGTY